MLGIMLVWCVILFGGHKHRTDLTKVLVALQHPRLCSQVRNADSSNKAVNYVAGWPGEGGAG